MASNVKRVTANARAIAASAQFFAYTIIALVVLYSDIMFVSLMWSAFPGGFLTIAAVGGAFATGISVIALVIGKSHWFRPGGQLVFAFVFTGLEVLVSVMNVVVSVMAAKNEPLGYLSAWLMFSPATPIVALVGWIVVLYLDKQRASLHEEMEMQDDLADAEREHKRQVHAARMELKATALEQQKEYLKMHLSSADVQQALSQGSYEIARGIVSEIIQRPIMPALPTPAAPALPSGKVVDSTAQKIDTQPRQRAIPREDLRTRQAKKRLPRMKPLRVALTETREVETGPLVKSVQNQNQGQQSVQNQNQGQTRKQVAVRKQEKQYVINPNYKPLKLND